METAFFFLSGEFRGHDDDSVREIQRMGRGSLGEENYREAKLAMHRFRS